jgi:hypothetical protein
VTLGHFIYIPGMLMLGIVVGYILGGRASRAQAGDALEKDRRAAARDARRRAREAAGSE